MKIKTFKEREKIGYIYSTYFNPCSEHCLDFNLFDSLEYYGTINEKDLETLTNTFDKIGNSLWAKMEEFDNKKIKER